MMITPIALYRRRLLLLSALIALSTVLVDPLEFVETRSIPYRFVYRVSGTPALGDYVRVPVRHALIDDGEPHFLTKRVACIAGERLAFDGQAHYCNGVRIDTLNVHTLADGRVMPVFAFNGVIPPGQLYLLGSARESFDSRYLGFFNAGDAVRVKGLF